jgi:hypothetical protein
MSCPRSSSNKSFDFEVKRSSRGEKWAVFKIWPLHLLVDVKQAREIDRTIDGKNLPGVEFEDGAQAFDNLGIGVGLNFHAHGITFAPVVQLGANGLQQAARFFFGEVEIAVASHTKRRRRNDVKAVVHVDGMVGDEISQEYKVGRAFRGQPDQTGQRSRN